MKTLPNLILIAVAILVVSGCQQQTDEKQSPEAQVIGANNSAEYSESSDEAVAVSPLKTAYHGELHLHTSYSLDAYIFGTTLNDPFVAYQYAQGKEVGMPAGSKKRLSTPLDFAAVTDHAEVLGEFEICINEGASMFNSDTCKGIREGDISIFGRMFKGLSQTPALRDTSICGEDGQACIDNVRGPWQRIQQAANEAYKPGEFTTFVAYEFSAQAPEGKGGMMHRNVIFKNDKVPDSVFSAFEGSGEDMHLWLDKECTEPCQVLTIPHNANFYWGRLYWGKNSDGSDWTQEQLERRVRLDRLVEIMQVKGNSECQTGIGTTDEECNFETVFQECKEGEAGGCSDYNSFVRNGLKLGLLQEEENGINPFKQGFSGGTDNHNGTPSDTEENRFNGHYAKNDADPKVRLGLAVNATAAAMGLEAEDDPTRFYNPGTIAGVWAESNTRESIWDALYRKETFATSGTRSAIRMFAGFNFPENLHQKDDWVDTGYKLGVPQGGDLASAEQGQTLSLLVYAERDPLSAPLAKIQVVKGWLENGEMKEFTYDVVCSDGATPDPETFRCPNNGATVNLVDCSISQDSGAAMLSATWQDPDFDAAERAFYYARALENPVCRWSMYDAIANGLEYPAELPKTVKERAWSSPVWYTP